MIQKHDLPILEYDFDSIEVIRPNHGAEQLVLPEKCVFGFLGDVILEPSAIKAIEQTFCALNIPFQKCITWTTDGFFRETRDMVEYRKSEGCATVEMECAALAACAQKRGAVFGQILYTADSLANVYAHDERDWGKGSLRKALELCINVLITM